MLLTEDQIAAAAGLPGPVVAELLQPGVVANELAPTVTAAVYLEEDALRAQVAYQMLHFGVRWRFVQSAIATMPDDAAELCRIRDFWAQRVPAPAGRALDKGWVAVLACAALLTGIMVGLALAGLTR
jgi:hypothetical protein